MEILAKVGQEILLKTQLSDGDLSLPNSVKALIKAPDNSLISEITMPHTGNGLFKYDVFEMPEVDYITVQYFAFDVSDNIDFTYTSGLNVYRNSDSLGLGGGSGSRLAFVGGEELIVELEDQNNL